MIPLHRIQILACAQKQNARGSYGWIAGVSETLISI
jgi:hypothetical protein